MQRKTTITCAWWMVRLLGVGAVALHPMVGESHPGSQDVVRKWMPKVAIDGSEVRVNRVRILNVRVANGRLKPSERARISGERLRDAIAEGLTADQLSVDVETETRRRKVTKSVVRLVDRKVKRRTGKGKNRKLRTVTIQVPKRVRVRTTERYTVETEARIRAMGQIIAVAREADAEAAGLKKPSQLAGRWKQTLSKALAIPGLSVSDRQALVPVGERRFISLGGLATGPVSVRAEGGSATPVGFVVRDGKLELTGKSLGSDSLVLEREGASARLDVRVWNFAAKAGPADPVEITGQGVKPEVLARLVAQRAREAVQPLPGSQIRLLPEPKWVRGPASGRTLNVVVPVEATGPEMIPMRAGVKVPIVSKSLPKAETQALFFSNNPERVLEHRTLYTGRLDMAVARLLWHHQNGQPNPFWFVVELVNDSDQPVRVQAVGADAGPVMDTVWVGFRAASDFLTDLQADSGVLLDIAPRSRLALRAMRVGPGLTVSGLMQLRRVDGPAPLVRVGADKMGDAGTVSATFANQPVPDTVVQEASRLSDHVYPTPTKQLTAKYTVGGRWGFVSIGRKPIEGLDSSRILDGNYGVFYDIAVALDNPSAQPADIHVVFEPAAGLTGAVFEIEGRRVEIPQTRPPKETVLARFRLAPSEKRTIRMRTIPLSGSNYPINLVVRSGR